MTTLTAITCIAVAVWVFIIGGFFAYNGWAERKDDTEGAFALGFLACILGGVATGMMAYSVAFLLGY